MRLQVSLVAADRTSSLRRRILSAGAWTTAGYFVSQAIRFGSNLLMTRILVPEMFGLMAIAAMVMYGLALISDVGLGPNIVYSRRGADPVFLNTAWSIQITRGLLMAAIALLASFAIVAANALGLVPQATVYAKPQLPLVIASLSIGAAVSGFESTKLFEASRNLLNHRLTQVEITSQLFGLACMLGWVFWDRSVWSLVAGNLGGSVMKTFLSHRVLPGTANRWHWDPVAFHEIIHFGKWIFLSSLLGFLINSGDRILLGGMLTASLLGVYSIAYLMSNSVENVVGKLIADVSYPALSEVHRTDPTRLRHVYYRFHGIIASFCYILAGALMVCGHTLIGTIYDRRYERAGWMLEILAVGLLALPFRLAPYCFQTLGMPKLHSHIIALRLLTLFVLTPLGLHLWGLHGALWGIVAASLAGLPLTIFYSIRSRLFDLRKELVLVPLVPAGMAAGTLFNLTLGRVLHH